MAFLNWGPMREVRTKESNLSDCFLSSPKDMCMVRAIIDRHKEKKLIHFEEWIFSALGLILL